MGNNNESRKNIKKIPFIAILSIIIITAISMVFVYFSINNHHKSIKKNQVKNIERKIESLIKENQDYTAYMMSIAAVVQFPDESVFESLLQKCKIKFIENEKQSANKKVEFEDKVFNQFSNIDKFISGTTMKDTNEQITKNIIGAVGDNITQKTLDVQTALTNVIIDSTDKISYTVNSTQTTLQNRDQYEKYLKIDEAKQLYTDALNIYNQTEGSTREPKELCKKAIEYDPINAAANFLLGKILFDENPVEDPVLETIKKCLTTALDHNPELVDAYYYRGSVLKKQQKYQPAKKDFIEYTSIIKNNKLAYQELGECINYLDECSSDALMAFIEAICIDPDPNNSYIAYDTIINCSTQYQNKVTSGGSQYLQTLLLGAEICEIKLKYDKAIIFYEQALAGNSNIFLSDKIARCARKAGNLRIAIIYYKKVIEKEPENWEAYLDLGWIYFDNGDIAEAKAIINDLLTLNSDYNEKCESLINAITEVLEKNSEDSGGPE